MLRKMIRDSPIGEVAVVLDQQDAGIPAVQCQPLKRGKLIPFNIDRHEIDRCGQR